MIGKKRDKIAVTSWLLLLVFISFIETKSACAAPIIQVTEKQTEQDINAFMDVLEDASGKLSFQDIVQPPYLHAFAPSSLELLQFGFTASTYWLRFSVHNHLSEAQDLWLETEPANLKELVLYQVNNSDADKPPNKLSKNSTVIAPYKERSLQRRALLLAINIRPQTTHTYYLKISSNTPMNLDFSLHDPERYVNYAINKASVIGGTYSALAILALTCLVLALLLKEIIYFYYGAYLSALLAGFASSLRYYQWLSLSTDSGSSSLLLYAFITISNIMLVLFSGRLLNYYNLYNKLRNVIHFLVISNLVLFLLMSVMPSKMHFQIMLLALIFNSFFVLGASIYCYYINQDRHSLFIFTARVITIGLILTRAYSNDFDGNNHSWSELHLLYAINLEAIIITATLLSHSIVFRQRKIRQHQVIAVAEAEARTQTEMLNRISHDIRTPMSGVLGMSELLLDTPLTTTQKDHVDTIRSSGQALLSLISEISDRSLVNSSKMEIEKMPFELSILINESIEGFRNQAEERGLELVSNIHADVPATVIGDATRLRQIILHLLGNAFKYTEHGDIVLTVTNHHEKSPDHILFTVKDNGRGISHIKQKNIFEPDLEDSSKQPFKVGLGLAISKQLISKMKGEIGLNSELGKGSEFWFSVSLPAQSLSLDTERDIESTLRNIRMLVVDDNQTCRKVLQQQASAWGIQVDTANNGNEALAKIRTKSNIGEPFTIIIIDHDMPGMNGLQLAAKVDEEFTLTSLPLMIMLTGLSNAPSSNSARQAGISRVLTKPVSGKTLITTLAEELEFATAKRTKGLIDLPQEDDELSFGENESLKILVAEDNSISQKVIVSILRKLGMESKTVNNGKLAFETLQRERFDLVLMDCEMPIMDGFEATRLIRKWEGESQRPATPIIALTAHIMDEHKEQSLASGMNAHLAKPVEISRLATTIKRWTQ